MFPIFLFRNISFPSKVAALAPTDLGRYRRSALYASYLGRIREDNLDAKLLTRPLYLQEITAFRSTKDTSPIDLPSLKNHF